MTARRIAVCDAETDPFKRERIPEPFIWGFYDGTQYRTFSTTAAFVEFLKDEDCICYAHNGGRFDWHFLLPYIEPFSELSLISGRIAKFKMGQAECRDSYNLLPIPLSQYKKDDIDYSIFEAEERDKPGNAAKIAAYLKSDCVYLWDLINQFVDRYGVQLTQAGASMKQWKKISEREVPRTDKDFYEAFAPYYYGGRVECFESGIVKKDFSVWDINSAYPFAMLQKHPYSNNFYVAPRYVKSADFFKVSCVSRGALPFRGLGAGLSFPNDGKRREYTVSRWEFETAKDSGTIEKPKILESVSFVEHVDFADYVNYFYEERAKCKAAGDVAGSLFAKLFMNSLYGKFAANPEKYRNHRTVPLEYITVLDRYCLDCESTQPRPRSTCYKCGAGMYSFAGEFGPWGLADRPINAAKSRYYNVATGASITGYVRAMLWRAICGGLGVLYCDTDSVAAASLDVDLGANLGQWKHEGDFNRAGIAGKKLYVFQGKPGTENKLASKGVRLFEADLWKVAGGGKVRYISETPTFSAKRKTDFVRREVMKTAGL